MTSSSVVALVALLAQAGGSAPPPALTPPDPAEQAIFATQVALDRAGFSPGVIDGKRGSNTNRAIAAYLAQHGREVEPLADALMSYQITPEDAAGPFTETIPADLVEQSKLPALGYRSVAEDLSERFHTTPEVLTRLNPTAAFSAGDTILVPNVEPLVVPPPNTPSGTEPAGSPGASDRPTGTSGHADAVPVVLRISRSAGSLTAADPDGKVIFFAPVTTGSEKDPLPLGEWKVNAVHYNPPFRYNPALFWDADPSHTKALIPPGPNGPVGLVWIDISKEHYGLHGSPEPSQIGRTESHGCVRLTNWDALRLAALVRPGTRVLFTK
jgi:lipoprotein-anchoring transpeptidase ErfK/SrfK